MGLRVERQPVIFDKFPKIKTLIFDVDGVWTDGSLQVTEEGQLLRTMNSKDGYAAKKALQAGLNIVIISGGRSMGVKNRLVTLGLKEVHISVEVKLDLFKQLVEAGKIDPETSLFMGDDLPDLDVLKEVFLSSCPNDAVPELLDCCEYISPFPGGKGCVRDVIEKVMRSQGIW